MSSLPVGNPDTFIGEFEEMDLSSLHDKTFAVAVSNGHRDDTRFICNTLRAPLDFFEMVEMVGHIHETQQIHAKVIILNKDLYTPNKYLDECTIDFIEARYMDVLADGLVSGLINKDYTCQAGFFEEPVKLESKDDTE